MLIPRMVLLILVLIQYILDLPIASHFAPNSLILKVFHHED